MSKIGIDVKELRELLRGYTLLYAEDNNGLRSKAAMLFRKFFTKVIEAKDGKEALVFFDKYKPDFVITDIQMPNMTGIELAKKIKTISPKTIIIFTTAYDDKEYLLRGIELKIDSYLIKPIQIDKIATSLYSQAKKLNEEKQKNIFNSYVNRAFYNQNNILVMLNDTNVVLANKNAFNLLDVQDLASFKIEFENFNHMLEPWNGFLYPNDIEQDCLKKAKKNPNKLFNVKISKDGVPHHFVLKLSYIGDKNDFYILSMTDITELNLLQVYEKDTAESSEILPKEHDEIYRLLLAAKESGAKIKLHNHYKGLLICNDGTLVEIEDEKYTIKTNPIQLKAAKLENNLVISCDIFPNNLIATEILYINYEEHIIRLSKNETEPTTLTWKKYLILEPDKKHSLAIFYNKSKIKTDAKIINISRVDISIYLENLPAGLQEDDEIGLNMIFSDDPKPRNLDMTSIVKKITPNQNGFDINCQFDQKDPGMKNLISYLALRQMKLVREFKGL